MSIQNKCRNTSLKTHMKCQPMEKSLRNIIKRHALIVADGPNRCTGTITMRRVTKFRTEESCIDIVMFSGDMSSLYSKEQNKHVLTRMSASKKGKVHKESDQNVLITEFNYLHFSDREKAQEEVKNLIYNNCQKRSEVLPRCYQVYLTPKKI